MDQIFQAFLHILAPEVYHLKGNKCISSVIDYFQYYMALMV